MVKSHIGVLTEGDLVDEREERGSERLEDESIY
jgi:hypothetical protein